MKGHAPLPPPQPAPRKILTATQNCKVKHKDQNPGEMKENVLPGTVDLLVFLPNGAEKTVEVNGSKAVMDLLIDLCSQYHLNPTHHTLELQSRETCKPLGFKPNTPVGVLDIDKVLIKQKVIEEKPRRPPPVVPEKTVRLVVNFHKTQKTVVRVSPFVPLQDLLPVICEKCDFNSDHLVLLRENIRREKVDLSKSLNDLETRELYALDTSRELSQSASILTGMNEKEEKGLLDFFKIGKKKTKGYSTAPSTPTVNTRSTMLNPTLSTNNILRMAQMTDVKKRRAPPPPTVPPEHSSIKIANPSVQEPGAETQNSMQKKRRAPAPPSRIPNKLDGTEFERSNTFGITGRQVPFKPPRGASPVSDKLRSPPQLTIPPPPPYPPSADSEIVNQPGMSPEYDFTNMVPEITEHGESKPESGLGSEQDSAVGDDTEIEPEDREETASVRSSDSCHQSFSEHTPTSEDELLNADDSGTVNTQFAVSFSVSLTGSLSLNNKIDTNEIPSASSKVSGTEEYSTWCRDQSSEEESNSAGNYNISSGPNWNEEAKISITDQAYLTLAGLDAELAAAVQESAIKKSSTLSNVITDEQESVPVTIIDEISWTCQEEIEEKILQEEVLESTEVKVHDTDRNQQTHSETMTETSVISIQEQSLPDVSFDTFYPVNFLSCPDIRQEPIKKTMESSQEKMNDIHDEIISGENKFKMIVPATELKYDMQVGGNGKKDVHNIPPVLVDPITLEAEITKKIHAEHLIQGQDCSPANYAPEHKHTSARWLNTANKFTNECIPKAGMRTFTVIPPQPIVNPKGRVSLSLATNAMKIDDQGNLILVEIREKKDKNTTTAASDKESRLEQAKMFWNAKCLDKDNLYCANPSTTMAINATGCTAGNFQLQETAKKLTNISPKSNAVTAQSTAASKKSLKTCLHSNEEKPFLSVMPLNQKMASVLESTHPRAESNFIKPCRRTSSQYVASAICRYTGMQLTKTGAGNESNVQSNSGLDSKSEDKHKFRPAEEKSSVNLLKKGFMENQQKTGFALHSNAENVEKMTEHKEAKAVPYQNSIIKDVSNQTDSLNKVTSQSQSSQLLIKNAFSADQQCPTANKQIPQSEVHSPFVKEVVTSTVPINQSFRASVTFAINPISTLFSDSIKSHDTAIKQGDSCASDLPAISTVASSGTETVFVMQSEPSPSFHTNGFNIKPSTNMFGPVKKFKPIVQKPVQKDECLHSSLMEAIQSGQNKERLRKISDTVINSNLKKDSLIAPENEHSALLASIRAHSGITKLKKTTSTVSKELQDIREYSQTRQPATASCAPPSAPPPDFPKTEKFNTKSVMNLEEARTALLEAIQSGTGAARLRKATGIKDKECNKLIKRKVMFVRNVEGHHHSLLSPSQEIQCKSVEGHVLYKNQAAQAHTFPNEQQCWK
ncbi:protein cordon-bleu isoform X4 [Chiloscyllium plagiosum]|nr:protein cordon-bleu isoform X4 [Chiloscyllium plagiosum]XP_043546053.1 protein cordon-bleu isoform X4 [Chiloscyllium plagiosum]